MSETHKYDEFAAMKEKIVAATRYKIQIIVTERDEEKEKSINHMQQEVSRLFRSREAMIEEFLNCKDYDSQIICIQAFDLINKNIKLILGI